jgi:integrase
MTENTEITIYQGNNETEIGQALNERAEKSVLFRFLQEKTANTRTRYLNDVTKFCEYLSSIGIARNPEHMVVQVDQWECVTFGIVDDFKAWLLDQGYSITTVNARLFTVRLFCKLTGNEERINQVKGYGHKTGRNVDSTREVSRVGYKKSAPIFLTRDQAVAMKRDQPDTPQGRRDALMLCLMLDHSLRVGEVASLDHTAINLSTGTLTFYRQKTDKTQTDRLTRDTLQAAIRYFEICTPTDKLIMGSNKSGKLVGNMCERSITERVRLLGERIGVTGLSAHDLRHTWAKSAIEHSNILSVQIAGGWNSPQMPLRYAQSSKISNDGINLDY